MPLVGIVARFPVGVFRGRDPDGSPADLPDTARLYSALIHAAGKGTTAIEEEGDLRINPESRKALEWFEANPPDALMIPAWGRASDDGTATYRHEGVLEKGADRKTLRRVSGTYLCGEMAWLWQSSVPDEIASVFDTLCADISCLGETDSLAVLHFGEAEATHYLDPTATALSVGGLRFSEPAVGRLAELEADYEKRQPLRPNVVERVKAMETVVTSPITRVSQRRVTFREPTTVAAEAPWDEVFYLPVSPDSPIPDMDWRVANCVLVHRALAKLAYTETPSSITGVYPAGMTRPANHLAVQFLGEAEATLAGLDKAGYLLMLPASMPTLDRELLTRLVNQLRFLRTPRGVVRLEERQVMVGSEFWRPPSQGMRRVWSSHPVVVPEHRSNDTRLGASRWGFDDSLLVSVGLLLRDSLDLQRVSAQTKWRDIRDQVMDWGVRPLFTRRESRRNVARYVHKTPSGMVVEPFRAMVDMGDAVPSGAIFALGQSRHMGGGLMVPVDLPEAVIEEWEAPHASQ